MYPASTKVCQFILIGTAKVFGNLACSGSENKSMSTHINRNSQSIW